MRLGHFIYFAVLTPLLLGGLPVSAAAQSSNMLGASAALNCGSFLSASDGGQQHAQAVYDADPSDPNDLDGDNNLADDFFDLYPGMPHRIPWSEPTPPVILFTGNH